MRILVLGAGAIGGYFGARLIEAGQRVDFLVRHARAERLRADGLRVTSANGDFAQPVSCVTEISSECDLVVLSCKSYDLVSAINAISPAVGKQTRVLPLLNGLVHMDALDAAFGSERVLGGFAHISVTVKPDGSIEQFGDVARLVYGARDDRDVNDAITQAMASMQAQVVKTPAIVQLMWQKFALITALAGATCLCRGSVGEILATADGREFVERLYRECCATAQASGYPLSADMRGEALAALTMPTSLKASMLRDIEGGSRSEGEHIVGNMLKRAIALSVEAPMLLAAATMLRVYDGSVAAF
ncbi:MAG: ketopantoate reductase family protein [Dokdonella sp.]